MTIPRVYTYRDAIDAMVDFMSSPSVGSAAMREVRRAIVSALDEFSGASDWKFLHKHERLRLSAQYTTGTIEYDHTGGTNERELTLTGGTWPSWAEDAYVRISDRVHAIENRVSDTVVTLDVRKNPGADISSGTSYAIFKPYYILPNDFGQIQGGIWSEGVWQQAEYVRPEEWMALTRYDSDYAETRHFTIMSPDDLYGAMAVYIHPASDAAESLDMIYRRVPRALRYSGHATGDYAGTIAVTAGSSTVTGTNTSFTSGMVGSVIRWGASATDVPSDRAGLYPFEEQRVITGYTSATEVTLDANVSTTRSGVKYVVSDPINFPPYAWPAFIRCCEKELAIVRNMKNAEQYSSRYYEALVKARAQDQPHTQRMVCGHGFYRGYRLANTAPADDDN